MQLRSRVTRSTSTGTDTGTASKIPEVNQSSSSQFDDFKRTLKSLFVEMNSCESEGISERQYCFKKISKVDKVYAHIREYLNKMRISDNLPAISILFKSAFQNGMRILDDITTKTNLFDSEVPLTSTEKKIKQAAISTVSEACSMIYRISKDLNLPESLRI